jgi:hypothetical protein
MKATRALFETMRANIVASNPTDPPLTTAHFPANLQIPVDPLPIRSVFDPLDTLRHCKSNAVVQ